MRKIIILLMMLVPLLAFSQIKKKDAKKTIELIENCKIKIKRFRVIKKRHAYKLSKDMTKMNYNVVFVVYEARGREYTRIFDVSIN